MRRRCTKEQRTGRRGKERMVLRIIVVLGKAPKVRKNTDGGANPRNKRINKTKP